MSEERIEWLKEGDYVGIESLEEWKILILKSPGNKQEAFDINHGKIVNFGKMNCFKKSYNFNFAGLAKNSLRTCFENPKIGTIYLRNEKYIALENDYGEKEINLDECPFNAKKYNFQVLDVTVAGENYKNVYFVGERRCGELLHKGLFCFPIIDLMTK